MIRLWTPRFLLLVAVLAPTAFCAPDTTFSGTVTDLSGKAVPGVEIRLKGIGWTTTADASGKWTLGNAPASGILARQKMTTDLPGSISDRRGRLRLDLHGTDALGRQEPNGPAFPVGRPGFLARTCATEFVDTLVYSWRGKRLARTPLVLAIGQALSKRLDTAWSDDHGYPWNDSVSSYGSLVDPLDKKVYRTVLVGNQNWMAENLAVAVDSSWLPNSNPDSAAVYGRVYNWSAAVKLSDSCGSKSCASQLQKPRTGICPQGWHLPDSTEWAKLVGHVESLPGVGAAKGGEALRSTRGYRFYPGRDVVGFRALPRLQDGADFWTANESKIAKYAFLEGFASDMQYAYYGDGMKSDRFSIRCLAN